VSHAIQNTRRAGLGGGHKCTRNSCRARDGKANGRGRIRPAGRSPPGDRLAIARIVRDLGPAGMRRQRIANSRRARALEAEIPGGSIAGALEVLVDDVSLSRRRDKIGELLRPLEISLIVKALDEIDKDRKSVV